MSILKDRTRIRGRVVATVFGPDGTIKRRNQTWLERFLNKPGKPMVSTMNNLVVDEGDACIADLMATTPAKTKFDNTNARMVVGTGWVSTTKGKTWVTTQTGSADSMESTYPKTKGAFGAADDNVVQYRVVFAAGTLNDTGIDEVALVNNTSDVGAECLAYAQINPAVNVTSSDTLQIDWELTVLGA